MNCAGARKDEEVESGASWLEKICGKKKGLSS